MAVASEGGPLVFIIAGEPSGDVLGAKLMSALRRATGGKVRFAGIGGDRMTAEGLQSLFPLQDRSCRRSCAVSTTRSRRSVRPVRTCW
jgi:lipid-A-disaccharide synthase